MVVVAIGCTMSAAYIGRLCTRADVVWTPGTGNMPWERVPQTHNQHVSQIFLPFALFKHLSSLTDNCCTLVS